MDQRIAKWLLDISMAIEETEHFFASTPLTLTSLQTSVLLKRAVERNLEIIGEAMNRILLRQPDFPIENARRIVNLRNQIIHAYDSVSDEILLSILLTHLPKLKQDVHRLMQ
ncbi:MAG: DUF86 domain-containing protein [Rufibacter sp.]